MKFVRSKFNMKTWFLKRDGQSLMEVVVALGVVLFVLISIVVLVLINSFGQKESENKVIATNLVREGIEVVRSLRDTAKLQKSNLQLPGFTSTNHHFYPKLTVGNPNLWSLSNVPSNFNETETRLRLKDYLYQHNLVSTEKYTPFQRQIIIDPICADINGCSDGIDDPVISGECEGCPDGPDQGSEPDIIGYRVKSQIRWLENNQQVNFELVDFLYDWR